MGSLANRKELFKLSKLSVEEMKNILVQISDEAKHYEHLADIDNEDVSVITGLTLFSPKERKSLYQVRNSALTAKRDGQLKKRNKAVAVVQ